MKDIKEAPVESDSYFFHAPPTEGYVLIHPLRLTLTHPSPHGRRSL